MNDILREKVDWLYNVLTTVVCIFLVNIHKNVHIHVHNTFDMETYVPNVN